MSQILLERKKTVISYYDKEKREVIFNLFSKNATRVEIYFYQNFKNSDEVFSEVLEKKEDTWTNKISIDRFKERGINEEFIYYGYRLWGPNFVYDNRWEKGTVYGFICDVDEFGNRFNPNKLLIDPYAKELSNDPNVKKVYLDPNVCVDDYYTGDETRNIDTGKIAPKSVLFLNEFNNIDTGIKPDRYLKDDIIYEVNIRAFTKNDTSLEEDEQGTYFGASTKAKYLRKLGVTAIELLPVTEFADSQNDDGDERGDNFWGYMPINYFSLNKRYAKDKSPGGAIREFKKMVKSFHEEGIKVILDVVYNHTGEGILKRYVNQNDPANEEDKWNMVRESVKSRSDDNRQDYKSACLLSYTGIDNISYYYLRDGNKRYVGKGGCGANLNYDNEIVRNLIFDSLKYWKDEMGVDGFRFDLAPILSLTDKNGNISSDVHTDIFEKISEILPARKFDSKNGVDLIAEPWGDESNINWIDKFPDSWSVWNKEYRDIIKTSKNKYSVSEMKISSIAQAVSGSKEFINKNPFNSINYIISHDDCNTLTNLFMYNKFFHLNEGMDKYDQISWDHNKDNEKQMKAVRNTFALLMFSSGTPMITGGDELFRRISSFNDETGKMNMVSVDDYDAYIDWTNYNGLITTMKNTNSSVVVEDFIRHHDDLYTYNFAKNLMNFRNKHESLRPSNYFKGEYTSQLRDIGWYDKFGDEIYGIEWDRDDFIAFRIDSSNEVVKNNEDKINSVYFAYNRSSSKVEIKFPDNIKNMKWYRLFDTDNTNRWMMEHMNFDNGTTLLNRTYKMKERSIIVLIEK